MHANLAGQKLGRLTVTDSRRPGSRTTRASWLCRCDCGREKWIASSDLVRCTDKNGTRSCGCIRAEKAADRAKQYLAEHNMRSGVGFRSVLRSYRTSARKRKLDWALNDEQVFSLLEDQCFYCGADPAQVARVKGITPKSASVSRWFVYNGIDRIDSKLGYTVENTVTCCGTCNYMKSRLDVAVFLAHIRQILRYLGLWGL